VVAEFLAALADRFFAWRDRLLAAPAFHRRSAAFWPTRPLVRRRTRELFDITAGFVYSQVLFACVRLDLFERLAAGPRSAAELSAATGVPREGLERLLRAALGLRLVARRGGGRWGLGELGAASRGSAGIAAMVAHHDLLYADLADPVALLSDRSETRLRNYWSYAEARAEADPERAARYSELMAASQSFIAEDVIAAFPFEDARQLLDVGGGSGAFVAAVLSAHSKLSATLFDLPAVSALAGTRFAAEGLGDRARIESGDMFRDALPQGADVISLCRILHDHDDAAVMTLLRAARRAIAPGGRLLIAEPMAETRGAAGVGAYFELYLWAMGSGRPRTRSELQGFLEAAGFADVREYRTRRPLLVRVLGARPAAVATS
jgi:demethylspheroidene O-methyltransferase